MTAPLALLVLIGPLMLLAAAVVSLCAHGPLGWLAAVGLLVAVAGATRWTCRCCWTWWQSTKAPVLVPGERGATGGRGPGAGAPRGPHEGTSRG